MEKTMARTPIHPGEIPGDELEEIGLTAKKLADVIKMPPNRRYQLLAAGTASRLSQYSGMSADFWMNLQSAYEQDLARRQVHPENFEAQRDSGAAGSSGVTAFAQVARFANRERGIIDHSRPPWSVVPGPGNSPSRCIPIGKGILCSAVVTSGNPEILRIERAWK
jgi:addiction module HigA family antidote